MTTKRFTTRAISYLIPAARCRSSRRDPFGNSSGPLGRNGSLYNHKHMEVFMKRFSLFFSVCILLLSSKPTFAQKASDYYLPLSVGNHINLYTPGNSGYWARTEVYTIDGIDTIAGKIYYREVGRDIGVDMNLDPFNDIFRVLWLKADSVGNVFVGALGGKDSTNIDSATVMNMNWFINQYLTKGYSVTYDYVKLMGQFVKDSVISVSETVSVPAGTFNNCIKIEQSNINTKDSIVRVEYLYYAKGIGLVKDVVAIDHNGPRTSELTTFATTGMGYFAVNQTPEKFSLSQNYPNPFNPSTIISYQVASLGMVSLKVYDLLGREVAMLVNEVISAGNYTATFNAVNMPSGVYFYRLQVGSFTETKRLMLLK
jgi:hypothetical protein